MTAATISTRWRRSIGATLREFVEAIRTIMVKELRSRMRGRRAFIVLTIYLAVLAAIAYGAYLVSVPNARMQAQFGGFGPFGSGFNASATIGLLMFLLLSIFQLLLVSLIAPAFTSGAISLEREKQTLDLLVSTPLRPGGIVVGKLLAALAYVFLMIVAGLPLSALVLMYGGVTVDDLLRQQVVLFTTAIGLGSLGIFFSALVKRTQAATVLTTLSMILLTIGTLLIWLFWGAMLARDDPFANQRAPEQLLWANPAIAMAEVIANTDPTGYGASGFIQALRGQTDDIICQGDRCFAPSGPMPAPMPLMASAAASSPDPAAPYPPAVGASPPGGRVDPGVRTMATLQEVVGGKPIPGI
jgi:ABC-type transport system involved in multi-copper enzyme maturation permease subunit